MKSGIPGSLGCSSKTFSPGGDSPREACSCSQLSYWLLLLLLYLASTFCWQGPLDRPVGGLLRYQSVGTATRPTALCGSEPHRGLTFYHQKYNPLTPWWNERGSNPHLSARKRALNPLSHQVTSYWPFLPSYIWQRAGGDPEWPPEGPGSIPASNFIAWGLTGGDSAGLHWYNLTTQLDPSPYWGCGYVQDGRRRAEWILTRDYTMHDFNIAWVCNNLLRVWMHPLCIQKFVARVLNMFIILSPLTHMPDLATPVLTLRMFMSVRK